jgi:hypothetical protein
MQPLLARICDLNLQNITNAFDEFLVSLDRLGMVKDFESASSDRVYAAAVAASILPSLAAHSRFHGKGRSIRR